MTDKRDYLAVLGIPLWLPRRPPAEQPRLVDLPLPLTETGPGARLEVEDTGTEGLSSDDRMPPMVDNSKPRLETAADPSSLRVRLLNHVGQTVPLAPQVQASRLMFQTSNLAAGVYYIEIQQNNGVQSRKVIVR